MAASRSATAMATWSISVRSDVHALCLRNSSIRSGPTLRPQLRVVDAESLLGRETQHADLALVQVAVDLQGRLAHLLEGIERRQRREHLSPTDELVGVPRLAVVGEVRALDGLELHPQMPVVVLDHVARRRRARDDGAGPLAGEDRRPHGLAPGMLEDDVRVIADQGPDVLAEAAPLGFVLGVLVRPEAVVGGPAVDDGSPPRDRAAAPPSRATTRPPPGCHRRSGRVARHRSPNPPVAPHTSTVSPCFIDGAVARRQHPVGGRVAQAR